MKRVSGKSLMKTVSKPWGQEELIYHGERYVMKRLTMNAGHRCSLQFHRAKHETVYVVSGRLRVWTGSSASSLTEHLLGPGESLVIPPHTVHRMEAVETSVYLEASTPELDDVVRLQDDYGR